MEKEALQTFRFKRPEIQATWEKLTNESLQYLFQVRGMFPEMPPKSLTEVSNLLMKMNTHFFTVADIEANLKALHSIAYSQEISGFAAVVDKTHPISLAKELASGAIAPVTYLYALAMNTRQALQDSKDNLRTVSAGERAGIGASIFQQ